MKRKKKNRTGYTSPNKVSLIRGGRQYFDLLIKMIGEAEYSIYFQYYIYESDETGRKVADALMRAASRKVNVYLLVDGYASQGISGEFIRELINSGVHFKFFEPVFRSRHFYFGRRLHHKLFVIDDRAAMVGGINISNKYNDMPDQKAWLDFALHVEGKVCEELSVLAWKTWNGFTNPLKFYKPRANAVEISPEQSCLVRMRRNDWVRSKNQISGSYLEMFRTAESEIIILCSYFIPGNLIRRSITRAIKRGIKIRVVMTGLSDVGLAKNAERFMYDWLLRHGVEIYEYQKNVLHGKIAICDRKWLTAGSYNINDISAFATIELNLDVNNPSFAGKVQRVLEDIITKDCTPVVKAGSIYSGNMFRQFLFWSSYKIFRTILFIFTFYFKKQSPRFNSRKQ